MEKEKAIEEPIAVPKVEEPEDQIDAYIMIKDVSIPMGPTLVKFHRGQVIDEPQHIQAIQKGWGGARPPMRRMTKQDLLDAGML